MHVARLIRSARFTAHHHYGWPDRPAADNRQTFGPQVEPHAHDWLVEIHVVGPIAEDTGFCVDLARLDAAFASLISGWDGGDLNESIPEVRGGLMQPSTESLARWLHGRLGPAVPPPARLDRVRVCESDDLAAEFPA